MQRVSRERERHTNPYKREACHREREVWRFMRFLREHGEKSCPQSKENVHRGRHSVRYIHKRSRECKTKKEERRRDGAVCHERR